jgi:6-phosphogluconolactonase
VGVTDSPKPPPERISLTFPALNRSRSVWFLVSGDEKSDAVARALAMTDGAGSGLGGDPDRHTTPASGVLGSEETIWFLDRAAASQL